MSTPASITWIVTVGVLESIPVPVEPGDDIERLRAKCVVLGVEGLLRAADALGGPLPASPPGPPASRQCFVMAPVIRELLDRRLGASSSIAGGRP